MGASPTKHALYDIKAKTHHKRITSPKNEIFSFLIFDSKTLQIDLISAQGERETVLRPKNRF